MSLSRATGVAPPNGAGAGRATRRSLRAEKAQLQRWRRLLRARLDLAVAGFAPPDPLGTTEWETLPAAPADLPLPTELSAAIAVVTPIDPVELMTRLRSYDRALASYGEQLDAALETSTLELVHSLVDLPAAADAPPTGTDGGR